MTTSLRHIARCVLVLSLGLSTQSLLMVKVAFEVRQDYVIEKLCINRDRPELKCEGYCHFSKMMQQAQQEREEQQAALLEVLLSFNLLVPMQDGLLAPLPEPPRAFALVAAPFRPSGTASDVFRPPRA